MCAPTAPRNQCCRQHDPCRPAPHTTPRPGCVEPAARLSPAWPSSAAPAPVQRTTLRTAGWSARQPGREQERGGAQQHRQSGTLLLSRACKARRGLAPPLQGRHCLSLGPPLLHGRAQRPRSSCTAAAAPIPLCSQPLTLMVPGGKCWLAWSSLRGRGLSSPPTASSSPQCSLRYRAMKGTCGGETRDAMRRRECTRQGGVEAAHNAAGCCNCSCAARVLPAACPLPSLSPRIHGTTPTHLHVLFVQQAQHRLDGAPQLRLRHVVVTPVVAVVAVGAAAVQRAVGPQVFDAASQVAGVPPGGAVPVGGRALDLGRGAEGSR